MCAVPVGLMHQHAAARFLYHTLHRLLIRHDGFNTCVMQILTETSPHSTCNDDIAALERSEYAFMAVLMSPMLMMVVLLMCAFMVLMCAFMVLMFAAGVLCEIVAHVALFFSAVVLRENDETSCPAEMLRHIRAVV